jgi:hypothetical protein
MDLIVQGGQKLFFQGVEFAGSATKEIKKVVKAGVVSCFLIDFLHAKTRLPFLDSNVCKESYPTLFNGIIDLSRFMSQPVASLEDACQTAKQIFGDQDSARILSLVLLGFTVLDVADWALEEVREFGMRQIEQIGGADRRSEPQSAPDRSLTGNQTGHPLPANLLQPRTANAGTAPSNSNTPTLLNFLEQLDELEEAFDLSSDDEVSDNLQEEVESNPPFALETRGSPSAPISLEQSSASRLQGQAPSQEEEIANAACVPLAAEEQEVEDAGRSAAINTLQTESSSDLSRHLVDLNRSLADGVRGSFLFSPIVTPSLRANTAAVFPPFGSAVQGQMPRTSEERIGNGQGIALDHSNSSDTMEEVD